MALFDAHAYFADTPLCHMMATRESMLFALQRYGISGAALISGLAAECDFVTGNAQLQQVLDPARGLYGYVALNSEYPQESIEQQRLYLSKPAFVAGALFPHRDNPVTLDDARDILNAHRRYTKPMAILVRDADAVHQAARIAAELPAMKFLLLTMAGNDWRAAVAVAKQHINVYLEISGGLDADKVIESSAVLTPRKVLYGSGLPYRDPDLAIGVVQEAVTLTRADAMRIYVQNAESLFNLKSGA